MTAPPAQATTEPATTRAAAVAGGLRRHAARGTAINAGFQIATAALVFLQRIIVAALLTPKQFGLWGIVLMTLLTVLFLKNAGIAEKFVQQDEPDQERAFQKAFTIDLLLSLACVALVAVTLPLFALAYDQESMIGPGLLLSLAIVGHSLQAPIWVHYRDMDFVRQRLLQSIDPLTGFVVTIALAAAGAGYWSLVVGAVAGAWTAGIVAVVKSPHAVRVVFDRATLREYFRFSWPVVVSNGAGVTVGQCSQLITSRAIGLAATGGMNLAYSVTSFTRGVDGVVTQTIYPILCTVRDRRDLLFESFVKSNRIALLWGMPFGVGVALFAGDLEHLVVGDRWAFAIGVVQAFGIVAAIDQLGFNWTAFCRVLDQTRPMAVLGVVSLASFIPATLPLTIAHGLDGFAAGWVLWGLVMLGARTYYLRRLFAGFSMVRHAVRAALPTVPAIGVVLLARLAETGERGPVTVLAELALFVAAAALASVLLERRLLREMWGYVGRRASAPG
jgi:O-antigen/teichoic acid export membrane protein